MAARRHASSHPKVPKVILGPFRGSSIASCKGLPDLQGIYVITCEPLGKHYVGQAGRLALRWLEHQAELAEGTHCNRNMQAAYHKFGPRAFTFKVVRLLEGRYDQTRLTLAEQKIMDVFGPERLFNVRPAGTNLWLRKTRQGRAAVQAARQNGQLPKFCARTKRLAPTKGCDCFACQLAR